MLSIICYLFCLFFYFNLSKGDSEKLSAYECGFDPFDDARNTFDVRFYLVAILFIIFDLEISFLFPWCIALGSLPLFAYWSMFVFFCSYCGFCLRMEERCFRMGIISKKTSSFKQNQVSDFYFLNLIGDIANNILIILQVSMF